MATLANLVKNIDPPVELSQAQYDALTTEQQNDGTVYFVPDGGGTFQIAATTPAEDLTGGDSNVQAELDDCVRASHVVNGGTTTEEGYVVDARYAKTLTDQVNSLLVAKGTGPAYHNSIFRGKYLGAVAGALPTEINTAIKNRTYDDIFIGDYFTYNGVTYRVAAIDYYYRVGDTSFAQGNIIVVPDTQLYAAVMNDTNITTNGYTGSKMYTANLATARATAQAAFGSAVATHRILCTSATNTSSVPSSWAWRDSAGVELMNEVQVYGHQAWGISAYDIGTQKTQFPLFAMAPMRINTRQTYWLQDVWSAAHFAAVSSYGYAYSNGASVSFGVRPAITLTYV